MHSQTINLTCNNLKGGGEIRLEFEFIFHIATAIDQFCEIFHELKITGTNLNFLSLL